LYLTTSASTVGAVGAWLASTARLPFVAGCEVHDNPYDPICKRCRELIAREGDNTPIAYLAPGDRYVEKLATPDVTIADLASGKVIHRVLAGDGNITHRTHGVALTPDEKELWISDQDGKRLYIFDATQMPPRETGHVRISELMRTAPMPKRGITPLMVNKE
jgi:hypothetical protein